MSRACTLVRSDSEAGFSAEQSSPADSTSSLFPLPSSLRRLPSTFHPLRHALYDPTHLLLVPLGIRDVLPDTLIPPYPILGLEDVYRLLGRHGEVEEPVAEREEGVEVARREAVAGDVEEACGSA